MLPDVDQPFTQDDDGFEEDDDEPPCPGPDVAHRPTQKSAKDGGRKYFLFAAAEAGCLSCVKQLALREGVDPNSITTTAGYTVVGFEEWGYKQTSSPRCMEVVA